jgi:hydrogenase maturation protein HypF
MDPGYLSSQYAEHRPETVKVAVQHHHAHVVSAMAEHAINGAAIGIAYDGGGYGTDGTLWGGEVLIAMRASFERAATFRPLALAGGKRAIQEPWRLALALVEDAHGGMLPGEMRALFADVPGEEFEHVSELLHGGVRLPLARGVGRYFEAFGALFLGRRTVGFEGQMAMAWNHVATLHESRSYGFNVDTSHSYAEIDLRPAVREALNDHARGVTTGTIAAAFHNTIAEATAAVVRFVMADVGPLPVVASGGCFQNARLAETVHTALAPEHDVLFHRTVPPGDGGIALGQAVIADAISRGET